MGVWDSSQPRDEVEAREADRLSDWLMGAFEYDLEEHWWKRHEPPQRVRDVLREYEDRGAPLGNWPAFLPREVHDILTLRTYGTPGQLQEDIDALERMEDKVLAHTPYEEHLAYDRQWSRLTRLRQKAEAALAGLREAGYEYDPDTGYVKNAKTRIGNSVIRRLYHHMIGLYHAAWPDDTWNGEPKKNPAVLQEHIQTLLSPFFGYIPLDRIRVAIDNR